MSDIKHTPGPWEMWTSCSFRRIGSASGKHVVEPITQRSDGHPDLYFPNGGYEGPDARLILAAPELLAALDGILEHYVSLVNCGDCGNWNPETETPVICARAAIAKATGKQP